MASLIGITTGVSYGASVESGILVQSFSLTANVEKTEVKNHNGDVALVAYHNQKLTGSVSGQIAGTTGVAAAAVASAITLANSQALGGIAATGTFYVDSVALTKGPEKFNELNVGFTMYPNLGVA